MNENNEELEDDNRITERRIFLPAPPVSESNPSLFDDPEVADPCEEGDEDCEEDEGDSEDDDATDPDDDDD